MKLLTGIVISKYILEEGNMDRRDSKRGQLWQKVLITYWHTVEMNSFPKYTIHNTQSFTDYSLRDTLLIFQSKKTLWVLQHYNKTTLSGLATSNNAKNTPSLDEIGMPLWNILLDMSSQSMKAHRTWFRHESFGSSVRHSRIRGQLTVSTLVGLTDTNYTLKRDTWLLTESKQEFPVIHFHINGQWFEITRAFYFIIFFYYWEIIGSHLFLSQHSLLIGVFFGKLRGVCLRGLTPSRPSLWRL